MAGEGERGGGVEGRGAEPAQHTKMETGRDANVHGVHHTNVQDRAGTARERNQERKEGENKGGENKMKRESENVSGPKQKIINRSERNVRADPNKSTKECRRVGRR